MKKMVWLVSYPKSGNTWMRAFLSSLLLKKNADDPILSELIAPIISSRSLIENELCIETSELTQDELEELQPLAWQSMAENVNYPFFVKVHDAYTYNRESLPLIPTDISAGAIYIVRNPLDVAVSFSHYRRSGTDETINIMADEDFALARSRNGIAMQVKQKLSSWSSHINTWLNQKNIPILLIRYEDMLKSPLVAFSKVADFCNIQYTSETLQAAIDGSSFNKLRQQEATFGFKGKSHDMDFFFRSGKANSWKEELTKSQVADIIDTHGETMRKVGYLDDSRNQLI